MLPVTGQCRAGTGRCRAQPRAPPGRRTSAHRRAWGGCGHTDDIAAAAGVGKGTLFRRFGSRAGLMIVLLDEDEKAQQQAFLFGPPPLGPDAPPLDRLLAFGRDRLSFADTHYALLSDANRDPQIRFNAPAMLHHTPCPAAVRDGGHHGRSRRAGRRPAGAARRRLRAPPAHRTRRDTGALGDKWESLARKLCGT